MQKFSKGDKVWLIDEAEFEREPTLRTIERAWSWRVKIKGEASSRSPDDVYPESGKDAFLQAREVRTGHWRERCAKEAARKVRDDARAAVNEAISVVIAELYAAKDAVSRGAAADPAGRLRVASQKMATLSTIDLSKI
jgi:hypothetical protein